jgi:hypothetical protein
MIFSMALESANRGLTPNEGAGSAVGVREILS